MVYNNVHRNDVKTGLLEMIRSGNAGMVVLVHKHYDWFENLFHSSISKKMADIAVVPVLIMPNSFNTDGPVITNNQLDRYCYETDSR